MLGHTSTPTIPYHHEREYNPYYVKSVIEAPVADVDEDDDEEGDDVKEDIGEVVDPPPLALPDALPAATQLTLVNNTRNIQTKNPQKLRIPRFLRKILGSKMRNFQILKNRPQI
jgi:hypothetical protein